MYVKPASRHAAGSFVPDNYNGTAFTEPPAQPPLPAPEPPPEKAEPPTEQSHAIAASAPGAGLGGLFSGLGGLRSDDLLLLTLILLLSRNDGEKQCGDLLPLLALLLFIG